MSEPLTLESIDRDGAIAEAADGLSRATVLKGALGAATGALLFADVPEALAATRNRRTDLKVLQLALVFEELGAAFYGEALRRGELDGETRRFARTVHQHEVAHAKFVRKTIRSLGGRPKPAPRFDFGNVTRRPKTFRTVSATLEETCVEVLNGAGPLVTKPVLKGAAQLVSVEARHVSWIQLIRDQDPVPAPFDPAITAAQAKARGRATGFIKTSF